MKLNHIFNRWAKTTPLKYRREQWLLSKWEVLDGVKWSKRKQDILIDHLRRNLNLRRTDSLIDLGCGGGWILKAITPSVKNAVGLDFSPQMLTVAREICPRAILVNAEIGQLPLASESFSKVLCYFVFINLKDQQYIERSFLEIHRILQKGGKALIGQLPDIKRSSRYDEEKRRYQDYCAKAFKIQKNTSRVYGPPIQLFNRAALAHFLKRQRIQHKFLPAFNPFYRRGEPETIDWRFDILIVK